VLDEAGRPEALPVVEAIPTTEDFYDFGALRVRPRALRPPRRAARGADRSRASSRSNAIPGLTDTSLLPLAAAGIACDALVARILDLAAA